MRKPRTFTYRIPLDDSKANRKIHMLDVLHDDYWITELHKNKVPNGRAVKNWDCVFYQSKEHRDFDTDKMVGGTLPGLAEYRYSLEWEPSPETELLEIRHANGGGTKIRGTKFVGTDDPRLPDYAPVDTTVPWTVGEVKAMFDGEPVPDKLNYTNDAPEIPAAEAREQYREEIEWAARDGLRECEKKLHEYVENCDHDHAIETIRGGFCEDCGRDWDGHDFRIAKDRDRLTVVGAV